MLAITVDLVPGGFEPLRRTIATMKIANVSDLTDHSNYTVEAAEGANPLAGLPPTSISSTVHNHDRRQSVWSLIAKAAAAAARAKNKPA